MVFTRYIIHALELIIHVQKWTDDMDVKDNTMMVDG